MKLGVAFGWHVHPWPDLLHLVRRAEALGFESVFVDGDDCMQGGREDADVLDGWTVTTALLALTSRIQVSSLRLVHHWNAARLAQAAATAERMTPGRLRFLVSIGDRPSEARFGMPRLAPGERLRWLDEALTAVRALWRGETVTCDGRYVRLDRARVRPAPPAGGIPLGVAGRGPRLLEVVAAHADVWDVNLPALPERVAAAAAHLEAACARRGRDAGEIARSMLLFTRVGADWDRGRAVASFRRWNPWFADLTDDEVASAVIAGPPEACREKLAALGAALGLDLPVADLSGLPAREAEATLEALAPSK